MAQHNEFGTWGEDEALRHLVSEGYIIKERDHRRGKNDIDIIALSSDGREIIFVEVKTRKKNEPVDALAAVTRAKMKSIARCANIYLKELDRFYEPRFDIITVEQDDDGAVLLTHLEDAFNPCML